MNKIIFYAIPFQLKSYAKHLGFFNALQWNLYKVDTIWNTHLLKTDISSMYRSNSFIKICIKQTFIEWAVIRRPPFSCAKSTFWLKQLSVEQTQYWKILIYFSLNCYLVQFVVIFSTLSITFLTRFCSQSTAFTGPRNLYWTAISSPCQLLDLFDFQLIYIWWHSLGKFERAWKFYLSFSGYVHQFFL